MTIPYRILAKKRSGEALDRDEITAVVRGAADRSWADAQLGAFLMASAIRGLDPDETRSLTEEMLFSGDRWEIVRDVPAVGDKHSTGGVGDKISLLLSPLLAACGRPVVMLTGRGLGHTAGTADKLESIPGMRQELDRAGCLAALEATGMAMGIATGDIAPADRRFYALRDVTATIDSLPLITASILSKKLATGTAGVVFDVKTGSGSFLPEIERALELARLLVDTSNALGTPARALLTDMGQPLGRWAGHAAEVKESLAGLAGEGPDDLMEVTFALCREVADLTGAPLAEGELEAAVSSGKAREVFDRWVVVQGGEPGWEDSSALDLAPCEVVVEADRAGVLTSVDARELGLLLAEAGGGRTKPGDAIDFGVSLSSHARIGDSLAPGDAIARLYLRREGDLDVRRVRAAYSISDAAQTISDAGERAGSLVQERVV